MKNDPMAAMYEAVREATYLNEGSGVTNAGKVAVLELVKAEILRDIQEQIDAP